MRLLKRSSNGDIELISFIDNNLPPYAILSHTWTVEQEVMYHELVEGTGKNKTGYTKILFCVNRAAQDGIQYSWVDTCCIDRRNMTELGTAINSMFRWYQSAAKCYVLLSDVTLLQNTPNPRLHRTMWEEAFRHSRWFTRGWTLQELLAPAIVEFFSKEGRLLGSKISLEQDIHKVTKIPSTALRGEPLSQFSVDERMSWAATRNTTLAEDKIYSLLGVFAVFLPLIYGEGEAYASLRLSEEIQRRQRGRVFRDVQHPRGMSTIHFRCCENIIRTDPANKSKPLT
jgi:hypothetical protein